MSNSIHISLDTQPLSALVSELSYQCSQSQHAIHQTKLIKALERTRHLSVKNQLLEKYSSSEPINFSENSMTNEDPAKQ